MTPCWVWRETTVVILIITQRPGKDHQDRETIPVKLFNIFPFICNCLKVYTYFRCYTTDPEKRWEDCQVPSCNQGEEYPLRWNGGASAAPDKWLWTYLSFWPVWGHYWAIWVPSWIFWGSYWILWRPNWTIPGPKLQILKLAGRPWWDRYSTIVGDGLSNFFFTAINKWKSLFWSIYVLFILPLVGTEKVSSKQRAPIKIWGGPFTFLSIVYWP